MLPTPSWLFQAYMRCPGCSTSWPGTCQFQDNHDKHMTAVQGVGYVMVTLTVESLHELLDVKSIVQGLLQDEDHSG